MRTPYAHYQMLKRDLGDRPLRLRGQTIERCWRSKTYKECILPLAQNTLRNYTFVVNRFVTTSIHGNRTADILGNETVSRSFLDRATATRYDLSETAITADGATLTTQRSYEQSRDLLASIENKVAHGVPAVHQTVSRFDYESDALGRRVSRKDTGIAFDIHPTYADSRTTNNPAFNLYDYNERSEVTAANRYWGMDVSNTNTPVLGQQYAYDYDSIGNRTQSSDGIPAVG